MCSNYKPLLNKQKLETHFGVSDIPLDLKETLWPGYIGPFIRKHEFTDVGDEAVPFRELMTGSFGLIPHWAKDVKIARKTYNARSETVHEKPSFRDAWRLARHCIIPAEYIYEPDWSSGKPVFTKIARIDSKPMGIAGLWTGWRQFDGQVLRSFTMLTVNADEHAFMRNFHKPEDEKRMVVILQEDEYDAWLSANHGDSLSFMKQFPAEHMKISD